MCFAYSGAQENPVNLKQGLRYIEEQTVLAKPSTFYGYLIDGTTTIAGKKALQVWNISVPTYEKREVAAYLHVDGTKVYQLGYEGTEGEDTWFLIYDFGLQPGDEMEGYGLLSATPEKYLYKCVEVKEDPKYNGLKVMTLTAASAESPDYWTDGMENPQWIVGVGSTGGLLNPTSAFWVSDSASHLEEVSDGTEVLFSFLGNSAVEELESGLSGTEAVYDLNGSKLPMSPDALQPGVYVVRDGGATRKIMVK